MVITILNFDFSTEFKGAKLWLFIFALLVLAAAITWIFQNENTKGKQ